MKKEDDLSPAGQTYDDPIAIAPDVYWVGFYDAESGLHCNPYLIVDGDEAVLIDSGSRPDFPSVMMKILQTGLVPSQIQALIYQHYDPDLVGGVSNFESMIGRDDLRVISHRANHMFIRHYDLSSSLVGLEEVGHRYKFSSGRELAFVETPFAHSAGSFVTLDLGHGVLFTSDIFGSYGKSWNPFLELTAQCIACASYHSCPGGRSYCPMPDILNFHRHIMTSNASLRYALKQIAGLDFKTVAPQHGSVIRRREDAFAIMKILIEDQQIGIDNLAKDFRFSPDELAALSKMGAGHGK